MDLQEGEESETGSSTPSDVTPALCRVRDGFSSRRYPLIPGAAQDGDAAAVAAQAETIDTATSAGGDGAPAAAAADPLPRHHNGGDMSHNKNNENQLSDGLNEAVDAHAAGAAAAAHGPALPAPGRKMKVYPRSSASKASKEKRLGTQSDGTGSSGPHGGSSHDVSQQHTHTHTHTRAYVGVSPHVFFTGRATRRASSFASSTKVTSIDGCVAY